MGDLCLSEQTNGILQGRTLVDLATLRRMADVGIEIRPRRAERQENVTCVQCAGCTAVFGAELGQRGVSIVQPPRDCPLPERLVDSERSLAS